MWLEKRKFKIQNNEIFNLKIKNKIKNKVICKYKY